MKEKILIVLFSIAVFINFLGPVMDPDFPFHLKTGEYIYQHREIPQNDPFSVYGEKVITDREKFILSQYWLAQIIFYKLYSSFGPTGIVLFRAAVYSLIIILLCLSLRKKGIYYSFAISLSVFILLSPYATDRPQMFTFLFTLITVLLIEKYRERPDTALPLYFLPPLMLLWSNMHGGVAFGIVLLLVYTFSEALKFFIQKEDLIGVPLKQKQALTFFSVMLASILFSYINPNFNGPLLEVLSSQGDMKWLSENNREYLSVVEETRFAWALKSSNISFWLLFGFVSILFAINLLRNKSIDITKLALAAFSSVAAFSAVRYMPLFVAVAVPLSKDYIFIENNSFLKKRRVNLFLYFSFIVLFVSGIGYSLKGRNNYFTVGSPFYPERAAIFLLQNHIEANMFNQFNTGSYLLWKLYPRYRVFTDTRFINLDAVIDGIAVSQALDDYNKVLLTNAQYAQQKSVQSFLIALSALVPKELGKIKFADQNMDYKESLKGKTPVWKKILKENNIDIIVHKATEDFDSSIYPLTLRLLKDEDWVLIYFDGKMQIFLRNKEQYADIIKKFKKSKESIYDEIIFEAIPKIRENSVLPSAYSSLAFALMMKENYKDAAKMTKAALELDKNNFMANFCDSYLALVEARKKSSGK